jgi:hypothetical protein
MGIKIGRFMAASLVGSKPLGIEDARLVGTNALGLILSRKRTGVKFGRQLYSVRRALEAESGIRQKGEADSFLDRSAPQHCGPNHVSALSDARKMESADQKALVRAFDKAVRRKPLAFAADAVGLWELHVGKSGPRTAGA